MTILDLQALPVTQAQQGPLQALGGSNLSIICGSFEPETAEDDESQALHQ